jgi:hypothetical protein
LHGDLKSPGRIERLLNSSKGVETAAMLFWALLASQGGRLTKPQQKSVRSDD